MGHEKRGSVSSAKDENNEIKHYTDRKAIAAVLNSYAHGASAEQSARSAGVDVATAYRIIADAIAAQESPEWTTPIA